MQKIVIAVGSARKPKLHAVSAALESFANLLHPDAHHEVVGVEVPSGVSHTPAAREELMRGARQRAEALVQIARRDSQGWNFFVGLEGGLDVVSDSTAAKQPRHVFLESWAYVTDGHSGHFGCSGALELPEPLAHEVLERGIELSEAIDRFAGAVGIRDAQGAWGVLSRNLISRQEAFRIAVIAAFAPFYNRKMYQQSQAMARGGSL